MKYDILLLVNRLNQNAKDYLIMYEIYEQSPADFTGALIRMCSHGAMKCPACNCGYFDHQEGCELIKDYKEIMELATIKSFFANVECNL